MGKNFRVSSAAAGQLLALGAYLIAAPAAATADECEVKIGVVGPMTGAPSSWGLSEKAATEFQAALTNEAGGLKVGDRKCKVKVFIYDAQYTAAGGAAASNYLASENVHAVMGPLGSPEASGFRPVAKRNGQVNFTPTYMVGAISPEYPLVFHGSGAPVTWGPMLIKAAKSRFKFTSVVIIGPNDQGGTDGGKQLQKLYSDQGVKAVTEYYQRGTTNFAPLATRALMEKPDTIELSTVPPGDATILVKQLIEAGYTGAIGSLGGTGPAPIIQGAGGQNLKAFYWLEPVDNDDPGVARMKADFARLMKTPAPENSQFPSYSITVEQLLRGISLAGTDQDAEKIAAALRSMTPESKYLGKGGWRGKTIYGINQELAFPVGMGMIVDGKRQPTLRVDIPAE